MSDFIPVNQSTPKHDKSNNFYNQRRQGYKNKRWSNNSNYSNNSQYGNSSLGSNTSFGQDNRNNIEAYLHPSMLQNPWEHLQKGAS